MSRISRRRERNWKQSFSESYELYVVDWKPMRRTSAQLMMQFWLAMARLWTLRGAKVFNMLKATSG
jgi:hypothetical protein